MKQKMRSKIILSIVALIAVTITATGCNGGTPVGDSISGDKGIESGAKTATVTRSNITPVLTLDASVTSGVTFTITAPAKGILIIDSNGGIAIETGNGKRTDVAIPKSSKETINLVENGTQVPKGLPIVRSTYTGFLLSAPVTGRDILKLREAPESARAQISGSGAPFDCSLLDPVPTSISGETPESGGAIYCSVPLDQPVIPGLKGIISLRFPTTKDALVLPIEAVAGSIASGSVNLDVDGIPELRKIVLGASNGVQIQVTEGLNENDRVFIPSPSLLHE